MTPLLEQAFLEASQLTPEQQDEFARWLLVELANRQRWRLAAEQAADSLEWFAEDSLDEN